MVICSHVTYVYALKRIVTGHVGGMKDIHPASVQSKINPIAQNLKKIQIPNLKIGALRKFFFTNCFLMSSNWILNLTPGLWHWLLCLSSNTHSTYLATQTQFMWLSMWQRNMRQCPVKYMENISSLNVSSRQISYKKKYTSCL